LANRIEIRLFEEDNSLVSLKSMTPEALESFLHVMHSLKEMAKTLVESEELTFAIEEGSAQGAVISTPSNLSIIYKGIDSAIKGQNSDKEFTSRLRSIQNQFKKEKFKYSFHYLKNNDKIGIHERIINSSRISVQRRPNVPYSYKLKILSGFFNQIGGKDPNYHFDYGDGERLTINCSMEEAKIINSHLYSTVNSLLLTKIYDDPNKKDEYEHKAILSQEIFQPLKSFILKYNREENLVNKLTVLHEFADDIIPGKNKSYLEIFNLLLSAFTNENFHLSELKTLLVITKPFKENEQIKPNRVKLLETYNKMKNS